MGQNIKSLASVCLSVRLSSLLRSQFWVDFDETLHNRLGAKTKIEFIGVKIR